jgi:hypothetical protein
MYSVTVRMLNEGCILCSYQPIAILKEKEISNVKAIILNF